jgi:hypothetical protein
MNFLESNYLNDIQNLELELEVVDFSHMKKLEK